jgi:hypothetical protein
MPMTNSPVLLTTTTTTTTFVAAITPLRILECSCSWGGKIYAIIRLLIFQILPLRLLEQPILNLMS